MSTQNCIHFTTSNNTTITIKNGQTFGRTPTIPMSKRISRQTFIIKIIPSSQQTINNQNNKSLFILQLIAQYIRINNTEYTTKNNSIIIYENDIINLVKHQFKNEQYSLTVKPLNITKQKIRKRKRSSTHIDHNNHIQNLQNPPKKRKIIVSNNNNKPFLKNKPKKSLKQLEQSWNSQSTNISNTNNKNNNINEIDDNNEDIDIMDTLQETLEMDNNSQDEHYDTYFSNDDNDNISDDSVNDINACYSDGVWAILVPTNMKFKYKSVLIKSDIFGIGRTLYKNLILSELYISNNHCIIENNRTRKKILLRDSSTNGTYINGIKLRENNNNVKERMLNNGDCITFGKVKKEEEEDDGPTFYYFKFDCDIECLNNNVLNGENNEFNVRLMDNNDKYCLEINGEKNVYEKDMYMNSIPEFITNIVVDIPFDISYAICEFLCIWQCIVAEIEKKRPMIINNKPVLCRKHTMVGSPVPQNINNTNNKK
eukprot:338341_1